jgi:hypothetical protein
MQHEYIYPNASEIDYLMEAHYWGWAGEPGWLRVNRSTLHITHPKQGFFSWFAIK